MSNIYHINMKQVKYDHKHQATLPVSPAISMLYRTPNRFHVAKMPRMMRSIDVDKR
jgi:hypothetical protein